MPYKARVYPIHFHLDTGLYVVGLTRNEAKESNRLLQLVNDMKQPKLTDTERRQLLESARRQADAWVQRMSSTNIAADIEAFSRRAQVRTLLELETPQ